MSINQFFGALKVVHRTCNHFCKVVANAPVVTHNCHVSGPAAIGVVVMFSPFRAAVRTRWRYSSPPLRRSWLCNRSGNFPGASGCSGPLLPADDALIPIHSRVEHRLVSPSAPSPCQAAMIGAAQGSPCFQVASSAEHNPCSDISGLRLPTDPSTAGLDGAGLIAGINCLRTTPDAMSSNSETHPIFSISVPPTICSKQCVGKPHGNALPMPQPCNQFHFRSSPALQPSPYPTSGSGSLRQAPGCWDVGLSGDGGLCFYR